MTQNAYATTDIKFAANGEILRDRRQVWLDATDMLEDILGIRHYQSARTLFYLDKLEDGEAVIACPGSINRNAFAKNKFPGHYQTALKELTGEVFKVTLVDARQDIPAATTGTRVAAEGTATAADMVQIMGDYAFKKLAYLDEQSRKEATDFLLNKYGDIIRIVDGHPVSKAVIKSRAFGGWGIYPQILTNYCKDYGILVTLRTIHHVASDPAIKYPRSFFKWCMEVDQKFGPKLFPGKEVKTVLQLKEEINHINHGGLPFPKQA